MKLYKTQAEVDADLVDGNLIVKDDVKFTFHVRIANNINAGNIEARDINAGNIDACNIDAGDIIVCDINAGNIIAGDITAFDIDACNITAFDITAFDIDVCDIAYYAFCVAYGSIKCTSHTSRRANAHPPICLDGELIIKEEKPYFATQLKAERA